MIFTETMDCVRDDILDTLIYIVWGAGPAAVLTAVFLLLCVLSGRRRRCRPVLLFVFFLYMACLVQIVYLSREPGSRTGVDLALFETWGSTAQSHAYMVENVILFLPFGFLLPLLWEKCRSPWACAGLGFLCSIFIEAAQLFTGRGNCQTDDVVTNTAGALIGWGISWIYLKIKNRKSCGRP